MRVIGSDGEQLGIMSARDALKIAEEQDLDLVKIAQGATPPVCKVMDYGKYRFDQAKNCLLYTSWYSNIKQIDLCSCNGATKRNVLRG